MANRLELQQKLESFPGVKKAYFQPPAGVRLTYPCIIYELGYRNIIHADNNPYAVGDRYTITVLDMDPDSKIHEYVGLMPTASFDRFYASDGVNHWIYSIYY